jgi:beta-lactamase class A
LRGRSVVAALIAYVLVGAFIGLATWKLTATAVEPAPAQDTAAVAPPEPDVAAVEAPAPAPRGPHLDASLLSLLQQQAPANGTVGLFVRNLTTGAEASVNADRVFPAASLYKLPILVETVRQIRLGRISPEQMLTVQKSQWVPGSGVLQGRVGESLPVKELMRLMIAESDNIAAMMLLDLTGLNNVNQTMKGLGLESTRLLDYRGANAYNGVGPYATSPADMGLLLDTIGSGRLVDQQTSDEVLRLLGQKQASDLLSEALPWNVKVAHKWGEIPGARHDAGIVFTPRFQYVIVVMTENVDPLGSPSYIRDLSKTIYTFFDDGFDPSQIQAQPQQNQAQTPSQPQAQTQGQPEGTEKQ